MNVAADTMEHQVQDTAQVSVGVFGKHPEFGDFVSTGISAPLVELLEQWFGHVMPSLKIGWAEAWESNFDTAQSLRFWFGPDLTPGGHGFLGVVRTSRDRVGRRFPLVAALEGSAVHAPVQDQSQSVFEALEQALDGYVRTDGSDAKELGSHVASAVSDFSDAAETQLRTNGFWAARSDGDIARLWQDAAIADRDHAIRGRSYVWRADATSSAVYVCQGWPDVEVIAWLMGYPLTVASEDKEA
ncbi:hypothetical protein SAMN04488515_2670 [Cognatiyoonia koreensis]|uniref:Type VI secretion system protein ImpM n=1 Tax=Cognatiyoonia koreensis TaxID=364200 RepID=A0A1I0RH33_9RHOB|nr:type VI secretion system-associated protein TagF [Cognatiyoonia koreensis]SEW40142.1 hypothetical protein SAMN04488515_2670 [Cognatiyoonia koreensis]